MDEFLEHLIKGCGDNPCWHCGKSTRMVDVYFEAPICSAECDEAKWKEYGEAERKMAQTWFEDTCGNWRTIGDSIEGIACSVLHDGPCPGLRFEPQVSEISDPSSIIIPGTVPSHLESKARRLSMDSVLYTLVAFFLLALWLKRLQR